MIHALMDVIAAFSKHSIMTVAVVMAFGIVTFGQELPEAHAPAMPAVAPFLSELKGISIGMSPDEVLKRLGKPKASDKSGMLFSLAKNELAQIGLGPKGMVRTIALIYEDGNENAPDLEDIFGPAVDVAKNEDGSVYKMVRYDNVGFWLAYSRTGGEDPLTTVTMRRIDK